MQSFRTIGFAIIALGVLIIPFSIIHEPKTIEEYIQLDLIPNWLA